MVGMASLRRRGKYWYAVFSTLNDNPEGKSKYKTVWKNTRQENKQEARMVAAQWELDKQKGLLPLTDNKVSLEILLKMNISLGQK